MYNERGTNREKEKSQINSELQTIQRSKDLLLFVYGQSKKKIVIPSPPCLKYIVSGGLQPDSHSLFSHTTHVICQQQHEAGSSWTETYVFFIFLNGLPALLIFFFQLNE